MSDTASSICVRQMLKRRIKRSQIHSLTRETITYSRMGTSNFLILKSSLLKKI